MLQFHEKNLNGKIVNCALHHTPPKKTTFVVGAPQTGSECFSQLWPRAKKSWALFLKHVNSNTAGQKKLPEIK